MTAGIAVCHYRCKDFPTTRMPQQHALEVCCTLRDAAHGDPLSVDRP